MAQTALTAAEQPSLEELLNAIAAPETLVGGWDEAQRRTVTALRDGVDALHAQAIARMIRALKADDNASRILRESMRDEVVYAVLRHLNIVKPSLHERVEAALESVRPYLREHGGGVELVAIEPPATVAIRLTGACDGCPASGLTLQEGVEKAIKQHCPEVTDIVKAPGMGPGKSAAANTVAVDFVSPFAKTADGGWLRACEYKDIPENDIHVVEVAGQSLILSRAEGAVSCFANACAHLGMPLDMGEVRDGVLVCPHHAFEYVLATGECLTAPEVQLQTHAARVADGRVEVKLS